MKSNNSKIPRRKFLKLGLAGLVSAGLAFGAGRYLERRLTYASPQEIAALLAPAAEPKVFDANGSRTLFVVGDFHAGFGRTYDELFRNLEQGIGIDKLFMEGVYDHYAEPDPHLACMTDAAESEELRFSPSEWKEEDSQGYYRLSKRFDVRGIEDKDLWHDTKIIRRMYLKSLKYLIQRDDTILEEVGKLAEELRAVDIDLTDFSQIGRDAESLKKETFRIAVSERNRHAAQVIDSCLRPYEVGALIFGESHCDEEYQRRVKLMAEPDVIIPQLTEKGINVIYIDVGQAVEYNTNVEDGR
jgi:hypothetical protein